MDLNSRRPTRFGKSMLASLCVSMVVMWLPGRLEAGPCASARVKDEIVAANKRFCDAAAAHDASAQFAATAKRPSQERGSLLSRLFSACPFETSSSPTSRPFCRLPP